MNVKPGDIYSAEISQVGQAADLDIEGPEVPKGHVVRLVVMYAVDLTTVNRSIRLGYSRAGTAHWFKRGNAGASAFGLCLDGELILVAGEKPIARVESAPSTDDCVLIARGIYLC